MNVEMLHSMFGCGNSLHSIKSDHAIIINTWREYPVLSPPYLSLQPQLSISTCTHYSVLILDNGKSIDENADIDWIEYIFISYRIESSSMVTLTFTVLFIFVPFSSMTWNIRFFSCVKFVTSLFRLTNQHFWLSCFLTRILPGLSFLIC